MNTNINAAAERALVVFSGGQDSTTCLFWAIDKWGKDNVSVVTFDYGQRHRIELKCAEHIAKMAQVPQKVLQINTFEQLGGNALTDDSISPQIHGQSSPSASDAAPKLPNTFVPGRNIIFLSFAAAYAYQLGAKHLVTGVAQTDYSGYPDCRDDTIKSLEQTLCLGMDFNLQIHTPLMFKTKAQTVDMAQQFGAMPAMAYSHTCYIGQFPPCGQCDSCQLRAKGFLEANQKDPLITRAQHIAHQQ